MSSAVCIFNICGAWTIHVTSCHDAIKNEDLTQFVFTQKPNPNNLAGKHIQKRIPCKLPPPRRNKLTRKPEDLGLMDRDYYSRLVQQEGSKTITGKRLHFTSQPAWLLLRYKVILTSKILEIICHGHAIFLQVSRGYPWIQQHMSLFAGLKVVLMRHVTFWLLLAILG